MVEFIIHLSIINHGNYPDFELINTFSSDTVVYFDASRMKRE